VERRGGGDAGRSLRAGSGPLLEFGMNELATHHDNNHVLWCVMKW
jgi:hypothetical protein